MTVPSPRGKTEPSGGTSVNNLQSRPPQRTMELLPRLSGAGGLAAAVSAALASGPAARMLLVFDFDRTLTNGTSRPGDEAELAKVVRGGEATVAALRRAHEAGAALFIITARRPSRLSVEQLFASMDNAQSALCPFFPRGDCVEFRFGSEQGGVPLARGGCVYASGYQKAAALAHIVSERKQEGLRVFFFDDSVVNSYVVGTSLAQHLAGGKLGPAVAELTSYWWDSFEEEMGPSPSMGLSSLGTTDSNYFDYMQHMLLAYGVSSAQRDARIAAYRAAGNAPHGPKARGVGAELASVVAASKASRAKMSGLAETLGARFARGPRPPPASGAVRAAKGASGELGALLGARRPPPPAADPARAGGWRAKAAAEKARVVAAASLFKGRSAASLPPGPLSAPRWDTAFQVSRPDEGTTGGLAFVATLAGAFAVKSANDVAEEWVGTQFLRAAGVPVPNARVVFPTDAEHAAILAAVEAVAKQYSRRGDAEGATAVMVHVFVAMCKYDGPLLLLELVPAAFSLDELGTAQRAALLLEPSAAAARARARLEAMGRVWVVDAALHFRDRFASRLSYAGYDNAVAYVEGRAPFAALGGGGEAPTEAAASPEQVRALITGNLGNLLLTDAPLDGSALVAAGVAAVDSHVKLVRGAASDAAILAEARTEARARLRAELGALLTEARGAAVSCTLATAPSRSLGWLRFTVEGASGHSLSDGALAAARLGALRGVAAVPDAVAWARSELAAARSGAVGDANWQAALSRIDEEALVEVGRTFEGLLAEHADLVGRLPPPAAVSGGGAAEAAGPALLAESELIGAEPRLWAALSSGLREVLLDERVRGVPAGPYSMEWPGWDA